MKRFVPIASAAGLLFTAVLGAAELPTASHGEVTRHWLELQRSGALASPVRQTVSGEVAENVHERYLNSFKYPIPDYYYKDKTKGSGSGK